MAKIAEKTAAAKGRETKLSKKSSEELIEIILRKDKTEKNLSAQISNLKGEVNSLNSRLANATKDVDGMAKEINTLKDLVKTKQEGIDALTVRLQDVNESYAKEKQVNIELKNKYTELKFALVGSIIAVVFCFVCILC